MTTEVAPERTLLDDIAGGITAMPHRILLVGAEGDGKSTFFAEAYEYNPIFIPFEDRLKHIDCNAFFKDRTSACCTSYGEAYKCLEALYKGSHKYGLAVLDGLDALEKLIFADVCRKLKISQIGDADHGKGYLAADSYWEELKSCLDILRYERGMTIGMTVHVKVDEHRDPAAPTYDRFCPDLNKRGSAIIRNWCDEVLFIAHKVAPIESKEEFGKTRVRAIDNGKVLKTTQKPAFVAKNSLNLPDELPFELGTSWKTFAKYLPPIKR